MVLICEYDLACGVRPTGEPHRKGRTVCDSECDGQASLPVGSVTVGKLRFEYTHHKLPNLFRFRSYGSRRNRRQGSRRPWFAAIRPQVSLLRRPLPSGPSLSEYSANVFTAAFRFAPAFAAVASSEITVSTYHRTAQ